jgi:hypothetical protein
LALEPGGVGPGGPPARLRLAAAIDELELILNIFYTKNEHSYRISPKNTKCVNIF